MVAHKTSKGGREQGVCGVSRGGFSVRRCCKPAMDEVPRSEAALQHIVDGGDVAVLLPAVFGTHLEAVPMAVADGAAHAAADLLRMRHAMGPWIRGCRRLTVDHAWTYPPFDVTTADDPGLSMTTALDCAASGTVRVLVQHHDGGAAVAAYIQAITKALAQHMFSSDDARRLAQVATYMVASALATNPACAQPPQSVMAGLIRYLTGAHHVAVEELVEAAQLQCAWTRATASAADVAAVQDAVAVTIRAAVAGADMPRGMVEGIKHASAASLRVLLDATRDATTPLTAANLPEDIQPEHLVVFLRAPGMLRRLPAHELAAHEATRFRSDAHLRLSFLDVGVIGQGAASPPDRRAHLARFLARHLVGQIARLPNGGEQYACDFIAAIASELRRATGDSAADGLLVGEVAVHLARSPPCLVARFGRLNEPARAAARAAVHAAHAAARGADAIPLAAVLAEFDRAGAAPSAAPRAGAGAAPSTGASAAPRAGAGAAPRAGAGAAPSAAPRAGAGAAPSAAPRAGAGAGAAPSAAPSAGAGSVGAVAGASAAARDALAALVLAAPGGARPPAAALAVPRALQPNDLVLLVQDLHARHATTRALRSLVAAAAAAEVARYADDARLEECVRHANSLLRAEGQPQYAWHTAGEFRAHFLAEFAAKRIVVPLAQIDAGLACRFAQGLHEARLADLTGGPGVYADLLAAIARDRGVVPECVRTARDGTGDGGLAAADRKRLESLLAELCASGALRPQSDCKKRPAGVVDLAADSGSGSDSDSDVQVVEDPAASGDGRSQKRRRGQ
jgi:hypothetical protein